MMHQQLESLQAACLQPGAFEKVTVSGLLHIGMLSPTTGYGYVSA